MLDSKYRASEQSGSEEEAVLNILYVFPWFEPETPMAGPFLTLWP